jgi:hypothetical protein
VPAVELEQIVGPFTRADGLTDGPARVSRQGSAVVAFGHSKYFEPTYRGQVFSAIVNGATAVAAGQVVGGAAGAAVNFALVNPAGSGVVLVLTKALLAMHSGTPAAGPVNHGLLINFTGTTPAVVPTGNLAGASAASKARYQQSAAGAALTGGPAPSSLRPGNWTVNAIATPGAAVLGVQPTLEVIDGDIAIPPGNGYLPLWQGVGGAAVTWSFGCTWEEIPYP